MNTNAPTKIKNVDENLVDINPYFTSADNITATGTDETLGSTLPLVQSSHSPLFIFDQKKEFVGIVSPYQALYVRNYPYSTKVSSIATMPPYLTKDTSLYDVVEHMLELRVYVLPIFNEDKQIINLIKSDTIFQKLLENQDLLKHLGAIVAVQSPITAKDSASVGDVFQIMKAKKVSRVILVGESGALTAIISRKDLHDLFMKPTQKKRFGKDGLQTTDRAFDAEKVSRSDARAINFATKHVFTAPFDSQSVEVTEQLIRSEHNSIVLIDKSRKPTGFLSTHDLLEGISSLKPEKTIPVLITKPTNNVSDSDLERAEQILTRFGLKMDKRFPVDRIEITFEEPKTPAGDSIIFNTVLTLVPLAGKTILAMTKNRSFLDSIYAAIAQIEKQHRRAN